MVSVHGVDQSAVTWDLVAIQLRNEYHCIGLDMRNHGKTDQPPMTGVSFSTNELAEDIRRVARAIGLKEFALVGMSLGGIGCLSYAIQTPADLKALTIVDALPNMAPRPQPGTPAERGPQEFDSLEQAIDFAAKVNPGRPRVHLEFSLANSLVQREDGKWMWKKPRLIGRRPPASPEEREAFRKTREALWEDAAKVRCPTQLVLGGRSEWTTPEGGKRLAAVIPDCRIVTIPGAGHTIQGDQPKALAKELRAFWSEVL